jgi:DnaJ-class molecular chaperone
MKLECDKCKGTGEMIPEREGAEFKKTGNYLPATDDNLKAHCRGGGDLGECDCCEGRGYIVTQTEASRYLMHQVKNGMSILREMAEMPPFEFTHKAPSLRLRAIHVDEQVKAVAKIIRSEQKNYNI